MARRCRRGRCAPGHVLSKRPPRTSGLQVAAATPRAAAAPRASLLQRAAGEGSITDEAGLDRAYAQGDAYTHGSTLYVAGSHTARDWYDNLTKIPAYGDLRQSHRYKQADKALKANPRVTRVVGHSLGGAVTLQLQKDNPQLQSRTYGAPVMDPLGLSKGKAERYANAGDPVAMFDRSAQTHYLWNPLKLNGPHQYGNMARGFQSEGTAAAANPDSSVSVGE